MRYVSAPPSLRGAPKIGRGMAHDGNTQRDTVPRLPEPSASERPSDAPKQPAAANGAPPSTALKPLPNGEGIGPKPLPKFNTLPRPGNAKKGPPSHALPLPPPPSGAAHKD